MTDKRSPVDVNPDAYQDIKDSLDDTDDKSIELWEELLKDGKVAYQTSVEEIQYMREQSVEFMKIVLLIGSFYIAVFRFGFDATQLQYPDYVVYVPFFLLFLALISFVYVYFRSAPYLSGAGKSLVETTIEYDYDREEYVKHMPAIYFLWSRDNLDKFRRLLWLQLIGIFFIFLSISTVAGFFIGI